MRMQELKFGIEIEVSGINRQRAAQAVHAVVGGELLGESVRMADGRVWQAASDSSIRHENGSGTAEVVSPILAYSDLPLLQEVVRSLRRAGAKANDSCGIHIHVGAAPFDAKHLAILAKMVYKQEPLITHALGIQQSRLQRYAKPMREEFIRDLGRRRPNTMDDLNTLWYGVFRRSASRYDLSRYHGVNFNSVWYRGTVEFRWFEGTTHAGKVKAYVQFVLALAARALEAKNAQSDRREFNAESAKYDFRCFLLRLGMIGEEFKTARFHLLDNMPGDAAFKRRRGTQAA